MINLLPDDRKHEIEAARTNVVLLRYNFLMIGTLGVLVAICTLFYFILSNTQSNAATVSSENAKKVAGYATVKRNADEYRNNLTLANTILDRSVNYTSVIVAITQLLPKGVVLDGINLNATDFGQQTAFSAHAKNFAQATELKVNFQKSKIFSNVFFQSITDTDSSGEDSTNTYPLAITISAKLNKVSP